MIYKAGLSLQSSRRNSNQALGFGDENESPINARKIANAANTVEDNVLIPGAEVTLVGGTGLASYKTAGTKLEKMTDKPLTNMSTKTGEFLVKHFKNENGFIGGFVSKLEPLKKIIADKGPKAAEYLAKSIRTKAGYAIKGVAGLVGAIFVGKEMPRIEKTAKDVINDLGVVTVATGAMN